VILVSAPLAMAWYWPRQPERPTRP
jgi:hypothetical protein